MSNIEEDIKLKGFIEGYKEIKNNAFIVKSIDKDFFFEFADYLIERIKELEEENRIYVLNGNNVKLELYIKENYIPKQKVKDKIEELKNDLKLIACNKDCSKCFNKEGKALYRGSNFVFCYAYHQIKVLEELLEEK